MPAAAKTAVPKPKGSATAIHLVAGDDEFSVKEEAARLAKKLAPGAAGEFGLEIIEGDANNQDEALRLLGRLNEALFTVGFFGSEKLVWLKSTDLLGESRTAGAEAVKEALASLADTLKRGLPPGVQLLISAIGCDKRRTLYKTIEKLGAVKLFEVPEAGKTAGEKEISTFINSRLSGYGKKMDPGAMERFRILVAPEFREIANELEKLDLYVGNRSTISEADVRAICSASRQAIIWDLTDALGARNLPGSIAALQNLLHGGESPLGIVMMLVAQFRLMLLARDLMVRKVLIPQPPPNGGFAYFQGFQNLSEQETAHFPRGKNDALPNGWRLYRCALAAKNFSTDELIEAMDILTEANRLLVSTQLDDRLVIEQAMVKIASQSVKPAVPA